MLSEVKLGLVRLGKVIFFRNIFFGVPHLATCILILFIGYVIASITYIHPVYGGVQRHDLLGVSLLP